MAKRPALELRLVKPQLVLSPRTWALRGKLEMAAEDRWSHLRSTLGKFLEVEGAAFY